MPELPEVQTIVNQLNKTVAKKKIKATDILLAKPLKGISTANFKKKTEGAKFQRFLRRAKLIIVSLREIPRRGRNLSNGFSLIFHLKITGRLFLVKEKTENSKYAQIIFHLSGNQKLIFDDARKFGYIKLIRTKDLEELFQKEKFGPEPMEKSFTLKRFKDLLAKKSNSKIKPLLMDQKFIAGVGNIYAQEACFCAKILPTRKVGSLTDKEIKGLYKCLIKILKIAIKKQGTSVDAYLNIYGEKGDYVPLLKVYGRGGEKCLRCKAKLRFVKLGGRGTVYCPKCQK